MAGKILKTFQFYGYALIQILIEPKRFFTELPENTTMAKSLGFCTLCSIFFTGANLLTGNYYDPVETGAIFLFNSLGITAVSACISYTAMALTIGRKTRFELLFSVHAFSAGIILLISWMSFFFWITEPWKWWLIYSGFRNTGQLSWKQAVLILAMTLAGYCILSIYTIPLFFRP